MAHAFNKHDEVTSPYVIGPDLLEAASPNLAASAEVGPRSTLAGSLSPLPIRAQPIERFTLTGAARNACLTVLQ